MKKRIASTLLALALVLSLFPLFAVTAQADEEGYPYHIWIAGTWITNENKDDVLGDGTVSYDPDSATLTLNNANIVGQAYDKNYSYGIHIENWNQYEQIYGKSLSDITIELIGDNRVESPYHEFNTYGISSGRQITFRGPGSLTVKSGTGMYGDSYAIEALNKVVIESGSIHATGGAANRMRGGINGYFGVAIHGGQVITDVETPTDSHNYGIWTWKGNIVIDGGVVRVGAGLPGGTGESPSMAFSKEPILSAYPETPAVKLGSDRSGSDASDWDGTSPLSDANVQYVSIAPSSQSKPNPFEDVSEADYCFGPVLWAYYAQPQITNGMDATHFGPEQTVTRGQCVTFLWRAMGCPEPKSTLNPFEDIKADEYWYKPVLWAVEQGITKGTDATHFSPYSTLSTQHMITFLYRTMNPGEDGWDGEAATWSYDSNRLPFGVNLSVNNTTDCPRGAVVTFLYRCLESGSFIDELTVSAAIEDRTDKSLLILARVEGGVSPYTYKWQVLGFDGNWSTPLYGQTDGWGLWTSTDGTYRCIVTDSKGKSTVSNTIEIGEPSKNILSEDDFLIYVEDSLNISGRGRVITGRVINGSVKVGDSIILRSYDPETGAPTETDYTVLGIEMFKKAVDNAKKGDYAGIWISSDGNAKAEKGDAIVKKGSSLLTLAKSFTGTVVLSDARTTPVTKDNRFQYSYAGCLVTASFEDLNGLDIEPGGSRGGVVLSAEHPVTWYVGQTLSIMAGGQNYGTFTITGIK